MYACWNCHRGFPDPSYELPNRAVMTMDDNELRKHMVAKCPHCGSVRIHEARDRYPAPHGPTGENR
jgi:DNA-directed RNA polymerase subunit RPC12/RpoP